MRVSFVRLLFAVALVSALSISAGAAQPVASALNQLKLEHPTVQTQVVGARIQLAGTPMAIGETPLASAERFRVEHAAIFGVDAADILPVQDLPDRPFAQPVMYNEDTGQYKFTLFRYEQQKNGVPVYDADLRLLVRNDGDHPLVLANSALRNLKGFAPPANAAMPRFDLHSLANADVASINDRTDFEGNALQSVDPGLDNFSEPRQVIWAGTGKADTQPVLAVTFVADNFSNPDAPRPERWRFVVDATTGEILQRENLIYFTDVSGNVSGYATPGAKAMQCTADVVTPFSYAEVSIQGGNSAFADVNGDYTISHSGTSQVTVLSSVGGQRFDVSDAATSVEQLSVSVTPPGPADFLHNAADNNEYIIAQANGYTNANGVRNWALAQNPSYPGIGSETNFSVVVNRNDGFCPGNAWYDGVALNFCRAASGYANTSFASVSQHEYGHHLIDLGGSGQEAYGEGMSDCIAMLITDDPGLGYGFYYDQCNSPLRNADNTYQYPCTGEIHDCGQLLSGCVWSTRNELVVTEPADYLDIISSLTLNSILLHSGSDISPQITTAFLTLDDDDGDLGNGTPHYNEIVAGFGAHNMAPLPPPTNDTCSTAIPICAETVSGTTGGGSPTANSTCGTTLDSPDVWYTYTPSASGSATFSLCSGTNYDSVLVIYGACPASTLNEYQCDDDGCGSGGGPSTITMSVTAGNTYYIRVTGWSGSSGDFSLTVTGPDCATPLSISFPNGRPDALEPGTTTDLTVQIDDGDESYVLGSGMLHYRYDGGTYATASLVPLGGNLYQATFPAPNCGDTPEYYISAEGSGGSTITMPPNAPAAVYSALAGTLVVHFDDNFETDQGWTAQNLGATSGDWQRGVPVNDPSWDYDPTADSDGSGSCYLTENAAGNTDVDGGAVQLTSPIIDMSDGNITISYDYFLRLTDTTGGVDRLLLEINNNGGSGAWTEIARHDTDGGLNWRSNTITQAELDSAGVTLTSNMQLRFNTNDADPQSINESGIDAFRVVSFVCNDAATCDDGILNQGEDRIDCGGPCPACDCLGDGDCDDGNYCDGVETCDAYGLCVAGSAPCDGGHWCDESSTSCVLYGTGDFDTDGDIDLQDFADFQACFGQWADTPTCQPGNLVGDGMIDLGDYGAFAAELSTEGPN